MVSRSVWLLSFLRSKARRIPQAVSKASWEVIASMGGAVNKVAKLRGRGPGLTDVLYGIREHAVFLFLCGVLIAAVIPDSSALPELWIGWSISLLVAEVLLCVRRTQPRIDDREVDLILAVVLLGAGIWVLRQWPAAGNPTTITIAWLLCLATCTLLVSGTRAMMWVCPAALPALVWLLPSPARLVALIVVAIVWASVVGAVLFRRGWAPSDQLIHIPVSRYVAVGVALVLIIVLSRIGVIL